MLVQLDLANRVVRDDYVLPYLNDLMRKHNNDHEAVNDECKGMAIVTDYSKKGKHTYRVDSIAFDMNVDEEFEKKDGTKISFRHYYEQ